MILISTAREVGSNLTHLTTSSVRVCTLTSNSVATHGNVQNVPQRLVAKFDNSLRAICMEYS
jgi:hypothetical protein